MKALTGWMARYRKLIVAVAGFALTFAVQQWGTGHPWVVLAAGAATAAGIWRAPNRPAGPPPG